MKRALTLVELLVSLTILTLFVGGAFYALSTELRFWQKLSAKALAIQRYNSLANRLVRDLRSANVLLPNSNQTTLSLQIGSDLISYSLVNNKIRRQKGTSSSYLTTENEIASFTFAYPSANLIQINLASQPFLVALRN